MEHWDWEGTDRSPPGMPLVVGRKWQDRREGKSPPTGRSPERAAPAECHGHSGDPKLPVSRESRGQSLEQRSSGEPRGTKGGPSSRRARGCGCARGKGMVSAQLGTQSPAVGLRHHEELPGNLLSGKLASRSGRREPAPPSSRT